MPAYRVPAGCRLTPTMAAKVLRRNAEFIDSPEAKLIFAVIERAVGDIYETVGGNGGYEARSWFLCGHHTIWCDAIGLPPEFCRDVALTVQPYPRRRTVTRKPPTETQPSCT